MQKVEYDPHNDRFVRDLTCPHVECDAPLSRTPVSSSELFYCPRCERPFEVVKLKTAANIGGADPFTARRARTAFCTRTGKRLSADSVLDFAGAGGGATRSGSIQDSYGAIFGRPEREQAWTLERTWSSDVWGSEDRSRPEEQVTSVHVVRGVLIAVAASGRMALFDLKQGRPLLKRPLEWANIDIDEHDPMRALRLPPAFRGAQCVASTSHLALFRDLSPSVFPGRPGRDIVTHEASAGSQFIGAPLIAGAQPPLALLFEGNPQGVHSAPQNARARVFTLEGDEQKAVDLEGAVRPLVYDEQSDNALTVNALGHVMFFSPTTQKVHTALPDEMLQLGTGEKAHLVLAQSHSVRSELWLLDDKDGHVRVWRTLLDDVLSQKVFRWELLFEDSRLGQIRGFALGHGGRTRENIQGSYFVLSAEKTTAAYSRAVKSPASDAVLSKHTLTPPVITSLGYFVYDQSGLWFRGFSEWSFKDKNPERRVEPAHPEQRATFYDRTLAIYGRQVFFAAGGLLNAAELRLA